MKRAVLATLVVLSLAACGDSSSTAKKEADNGASTTAELKNAPKPGDEELAELLAKAERDCFIGASLTVKPTYRWTFR